MESRGDDGGFGPGWLDDDDLLIAEVGEAVREAAVPESFLHAGRVAFGWRTADAELADLRADVSAAEPLGLRGDRPAVRALSFAAGGLALEIEIHPDAVRGQLVPAQPGAVRVRTDAGASPESTVDDVGWFVIAPVPAGRFRLHVRTAAGVAVVTGWITPEA